jgi:spore germination cell wall hydrolase CwlJ-like protein
MRHTLLLLALLPTAVELGSHITCFRDQSIKIDLVQEKCLAVMIYGEARGEQQQGQVAVAYTAVNRAAKKTVCQVVLSPKQYSIFNNNPSLRIAAMSENLEPIQKNTIDQTSWENAVTVSQLVMRKLVVDPTKGSTHYVADKVMKLKGYRYPRWTKEYTQVTTIDNHRFFKENDKKKSVDKRAMTL